MWFSRSYAGSCKRIRAEYTGVDKYRNLLVPENAKFYPDDMLYFMSRQESNSAHIVMNGVDPIIIPTYHGENQIYLERLLDEIARVTGEDHFVLTKGSGVFLDMLLSKNFQKQRISDEIYLYFKSAKLQLQTDYEALHNM